MSDESRDRFAIEKDIANVGHRIGHLTGLLRGGETAEQLADVPSALARDGNELQRLAAELATAWGHDSASA
ncbi:MAG TPA: hypothetical protein VH061_07755 [Solirubrobacteraceae bacterium]|jgi:hypothetical protein|nr:hypothetical protein [Solirubrobacteraceae bacterium]